MATAKRDRSAPPDKRDRSTPPDKRDRSTPPDAAPHESAPRFALGWALLVYAIAVLMLAYPALGGDSS